MGGSQGGYSMLDVFMKLMLLYSLSYDPPINELMLDPLALLLVGLTFLSLVIHSLSVPHCD